jgi:hypothetical protein
MKISINTVYKLVWVYLQRAFVAVLEHSNSQGIKGLSKSVIAASVAAVLSAGSLIGQAQAQVFITTDDMVVVDTSSIKPENQPYEINASVMAKQVPFNDKHYAIDNELLTVGLNLLVATA